ncbi:MAG: threonine/serine dehydratase [Thaumarchaeota archaeon]|nr:threonine/serine dehydratase [Nitrososphaerota archaeon]
MSRDSLPGLKDIVEAARRIEGVAVRTPLVESPALSRILGPKIYLKLECFQPIRVFKIRGAYNKISRIKSKKVIAASSGNHGIAVSYCSRLLGKGCTIVVPESVVQEKLSAIQEFGAEVVKFGRSSVEREMKAREMARKEDASFVHPFEDPEVIAGQGTCGLEILEQLKEFDSVIVPVGGGGLISGVAIAVKAEKPSAKVFGVEPSGAAKLHAALEARRIVTVEDPKSIADGLIPSSLGQLTFEACSRYVEGSFVVSEEQLITSVGLMLREAHVLSEPSGAAPVAALVAKKEIGRLGECVVLVVSGGNVSLKLLNRILSSDR